MTLARHSAFLGAEPQGHRKQMDRLLREAGAVQGELGAPAVKARQAEADRCERARDPKIERCIRRCASCSP